MPGQFTKLASDEARDRKKSAKRELQEKARQELAKVRDSLLTRSNTVVPCPCHRVPLQVAYMLSVRELLASLGEEGVLEDLAQVMGVSMAAENKLVLATANLATRDLGKSFSKLDKSYCLHLLKGLDFIRCF